MPRRRRKKRLVSEGDLAPLIAEGLTQGASEEEALQEHQPVGSSGVDLLRSMREEQRLPGTRQPFGRFVASEDTNSVWVDEPTGRLQRNAVKVYTGEGLRLLREGRQCLRCDEPHPDDPFPANCDLCGYSMRDRQIMDLAMEMEGERHLGPAKPITDYLEEQSERRERREFEARRRSGGRGITVERKVYSPAAAREKFSSPQPQIVLPPGVSV